MDGIKVGYAVLTVNGISVNGRMIQDVENQGETDVLAYLQDSSHFPVSIKFGRPPLRANERIMLASTFHSLYAISAQLSPEQNSSGILSMDTDVFRLHCMQTITGTKKLYQIYADYALKNPFYLLEMPVRFDLFDQNVQAA
ncbi:putative Trafficking protein particle complex subunit 4 [Hypsibius exemplaris]|uniref:Trafficking protein particle complex subunit n=1 Tax=Hypsibius exemplaris TaxID=2072580 RepID=A0A1W0X468_HYPEX|nr:putative Trafficking protein particle complex subunit 4 [Hypsibius exemplaris]